MTNIWTPAVWMNIWSTLMSQSIRTGFIKLYIAFFCFYQNPGRQSPVGRLLQFSKHQISGHYL
jgi:hypothetical protein